MVTGILPKRTKAFEFSLSSIFVDHYMPHANPTFVKVYLFGMRQCFAGESMDIHTTAVALDLLDSDVIQAWKYWDSVGVVHYTASGEETQIEFLELSAPAKEKKETKAEKPAQKSIPLSVSVTETKPSYSAAEIMQATEGNKMVSGMFRSAELLLNKPLSQNDTRTLYSLHDWLGLPCEVILMLIEHCVSIGKTSMRYIEKVALSWVDDGITTVKKAQKYLLDNADRQKLLRKYKRLLKITDRDLSDAETQYILNWTGSLGMGEPLIKEAYEKTVAYTGKLSFPYMNKILESWHKEGVRQVEDIPQDRPANTAYKRVSTRFTNYQQRETDDYDRLQAEAIAYVKNFKKGE